MASRTLTISIVGDASKLKKATSQAEAETGKLSGFVQKHSAVVTGLGIAAAGAVVKSVSTFTNVGKEVSKLQRLTGGTAEEMSHLRFAAQQSAIPVDKLATALGIASKNIVAGKFDKFGIETKTAAGNVLPMSQILGEVADKFAAMPNGIEKNNMAMQLFGKSGTALLPVLNKGSAGLAELSKKADELGVTLDQSQVDKMKKSVAATRDFQASLQGLQISLGETVIPALTSAAGAATRVDAAFNHLPEPVKEATFAAIAGAAAWAKFGKSLYSAETGITSLGKAGIVGAAGIGAFAATTKGLNAIVNSLTIKSDAEGIAASLELLANKRIFDGELPARYGQGLSKLGDDFKTLQTSFGDRPLDKLFGFKDRAAVKDINAIDRALAGMVKGGNLRGAREAFMQIQAALADQGISANDVARRFDDYVNAAYNAGVKGKAAAEAPGPSIKEQQGQWQALTDAIKTNKDQLASQFDAQLALPGARADVLNAQGAYNTALANARDGRGNQLADDQEAIRTREALGRAILRQADLEAKALKVTGDAKRDDASATHRQLDVLGDYTAKLGPNDPLRKNMNEYIWRLGVMQTMQDRLNRSTETFTHLGTGTGNASAVPGGLGGGNVSGSVSMPGLSTQTAASAPGSAGGGISKPRRASKGSTIGTVVINAHGRSVDQALRDIKYHTRGR